MVYKLISRIIGNLGIGW